LQLIAFLHRITELLLYVKKKIFPRGCAIKILLLYCLIVRANGWLAQLVERLPYKQDVTGSSPVLPIFLVGVSKGVKFHAFIIII